MQQANQNKNGQHDSSKKPNPVQEVSLLSGRHVRDSAPVKDAIELCRHGVHAGDRDGGQSVHVDLERLAEVTSYFPVRIGPRATRVCEGCLSEIVSECTVIR